MNFLTHFKFFIFVTKPLHLFYNKEVGLCNFRNNSYFQYQYNCEVEKAVNRQIQAEQQAAQEYLNMAVYFLHPNMGRPGTGGFFMHMYEEELGHMQDFVHYQLMRGGNILIASLTAPSNLSSLSLYDAFTRSLWMEKEITQLLEDIVRTAEKVKDYQCADYITSVFLAEQIKSINNMSHHVTKLARLRCDEHALYQYDLQLMSSHPYTYKERCN